MDKGAAWISRRCLEGQSPGFKCLESLSKKTEFWYSRGTDVVKSDLDSAGPLADQPQHSFLRAPPAGWVAVLPIGVGWEARSSLGSLNLAEQQAQSIVGEGWDSRRWPCCTVPETTENGFPKTSWGGFACIRSL